MEYARNFMEYLNQKRNIPFEVHAFSSAEMFLEFAKNNETEILLISDKAMKEEIRRYPIRQIIILSEGVHSPVLDQYPAVYKYQSSEKVIREVMACYGVENGVDTSPALLPKKEMRIIGIYSPVGRTMKTTFALTLGQVLAREEKVLYITLEEFSGLSALTGTVYTGGLSDLLYYYTQREYSSVRLGSVTYNWGELDYIPPVTYAEDKNGIRQEVFSGLVQRIAADGTYEELILDVGGFCGGSEELLGICDVVYVPIKDDVVSTAKLEEWKTYLNRSGRSAVWEKLRFLKLPEPGPLPARESYLEQLL